MKIMVYKSDKQMTPKCVKNTKNTNIPGFMVMEFH